MKTVKLENGNYKEIRYWDNKETRIQSEQYYNSKDEFHRVDGPTVIWYFKSGEIERKIYYINGKWSRLDGPSNIWYLESGEIEDEYYWINGKEYTKEEYYKKLNIDRNLKLLNKK